MSVYIVSYTGVTLGIFSTATRAQDYIARQPQGSRMVVDVRQLDAIN